MGGLSWDDSITGLSTRLKKAKFVHILFSFNGIAVPPKVNWSNYAEKVENVKRHEMSGKNINIF
jgi:hypothetical protein